MNSKNEEPKYYCFVCNFGTDYKSDWNRHIKSKKHRKNENEMNEQTKKQTFLLDTHDVMNTKHSDTREVFTCDCGKTYVYRKGLYRHMKSGNCNKTNLEDFIMKKVDELIQNNVKQSETNKALLEKINQLSTEQGSNSVISINPETGKPLTNTKIINSYGDYQPQYVTAIKDSQINMKVYLDENCSQALNLSSFIKNIKLNSEDLDNTRERGLAYSLGKVFLRGLKELDKNMRPICCSDSQKSIMYVKDNDEWDVDRKESQIRGAIGILSVKHIAYIKEWENANPSWDKTEKGKQMYAEMVHKILENAREEDKEKIENKVIKTIAKETLVTDMV